MVRGIRTHDLTRIIFKILSTLPKEVVNAWSISNFIRKKIKLFGQKTRDNEKKIIQNMEKIASTSKLLRFSDPRP